MTLSMYEASVGVFVPFLGNLSDLLDRAAAHAETRKIEPEVMLGLRLYPNMYSLRQQVGEANRHAILAGALLAGCEPLAVPDAVPDFSELKSGIRAVVCFLESLPRAAIDGAADREVVFTFKNGNQRAFTGRSLLLSFSVPQFFFHITTAYDILRHAGVELAKRDFLGASR
jgi:uncharacterized protein